MTRLRHVLSLCGLTSITVLQCEILFCSPLKAKAQRGSQGSWPWRRASTTQETSVSGQYYVSAWPYARKFLVSNLLAVWSKDKIMKRGQTHKAGFIIVHIPAIPAHRLGAQAQSRKVGCGFTKNTFLSSINVASACVQLLAFCLMLSIGPLSSSQIFLAWHTHSVKPWQSGYEDHLERERGKRP